MFKLESYITPWLLSYIDQYVKLRREDFQLSLWGGDVVFSNLELRLANIQKLVPTLPISFQSGIIHELRIHIPWIRINSEPIVVTINQIELVIVLNKERTSNPIDNNNTSSFSSTSFQREFPSEPILVQQQQPSTPEQSNYVQTVLARILNNVQIVVNNLIVKFVEENIVISLSSRTAQCYAVNSDWNKTFIELTPQDLSLRRLITLPDITLCLDKRDVHGKVHRYEVPLLSRCSFECRMQMFYSNIYQQLQTKPIQMRLSFHCANIEVSIVDSQFSMIMRLTEIIMMLVNQQFHSNDEQSDIHLEKNNSSLNEIKIEPIPSTSVEITPITNEPTIEDENQPGWVSWAWSYVPSITTIFAEDDPPSDDVDSSLPSEPLDKVFPSTEELTASTIANNSTPTPILFAGIDLDRISLQYKVTKFHGEKSRHVPFISFTVQQANIIVERYKPTSTLAIDGQSVVSSVRKVKVSTASMALIWDECLAFSLGDVHFTLHYDRHVRMTRLNLSVNDLNVRLNDLLLIYPCTVTLTLDHLRTYSLLRLEFSSLTGKMNFNILAYLITFINTIRNLVEIALSIFRNPQLIDETIHDDIISVDDLRNGSMKCIFNSSNEYPNTNEILFSSSLMTWKYAQRRSILKCHILPLPFDDDLIVSSNQKKTVECLMQYWHFDTKQFLTWQTFDLSDGEPLFLDFSNELGQNPYSYMWRIVLINGLAIIQQANSLAASTRIDSLQSQRYEPSIEMVIVVPNIRGHFMITPDQDVSSKFQSILHGCSHDVLTLNLDNVSLDFSQRLETKSISIQTTLSLDALEYRFLTKRSCLEPTLISIDLLIDTSPSSVMTSASAIFDSINGKYGQIFRAAKSSIVHQLAIHMDHINIRLSQSLCHLINILYQDWIRSDMIKVLELKNLTKEVLILTANDQTSYYTYYLFTNHLNCSVGLKQFSTNEDFIYLQPHLTTDFIWSKINCEQLLVQFALEHSSNEPFVSPPVNIHSSSLSKQQQIVVHFEQSPYRFHVHIDLDEHRIRRHIHLIGPLIVKNVCNVDLRVTFFLAVGSTQIELFVPRNGSYVSCLQTMEDIQAFQWNCSTIHTLENLNSDGILSASDQMSLWIHLFQTTHSSCLVFAPLIVYRSYLTQPIQLHLNSKGEINPEISIELEPDGYYTYFYNLHSTHTYEHRLQQLDALLPSQCVFEFHHQSHLETEHIENLDLQQTTTLDFLLQTQVPFTSYSNSTSSSSVIDLLREQHLKYKKLDDEIPIPLIQQNNDALSASLVPTIGANGPAMYDPTTSFATQKPIDFSYSSDLTTNSIDCRIESVRLYSHLNTILIQLKPLTLVNNCTPFNFHLHINAGHDNIYLGSYQLTCLAKLIYSQIQFVLIDPDDGEHIQCQSIQLFSRNISMIGSIVNNNRLYTNGFVDLYFIKSSNSDYFLFRIQHEYIDRTHILTIKPKYLFHNRTNQHLTCHILPMSKQQQQYTIDYGLNVIELNDDEQSSTALYRFQGVPSSEIVHYLLFEVKDINQQYARYISKPIQLSQSTDEHGTRQCLCLFQRDNLLQNEQTKSKITRSSPAPESPQSIRGELLSIVQSTTTPTSSVYIHISQNPAWSFVQIVNSCPCPLLCRLENITSMPHILPPFSSTLIGIDAVELAANINSISHQNAVIATRLFLAQFPLGDSIKRNDPNATIKLMTTYFHHLTAANTVQWSRPVKIDPQLEDVFLPIPGLHDVLIRSLSVSLFASRTLIIEPVHRQRATKTIITSKSNSTVKTLSTPAGTSIISETIPRQYRSSILPLHSPDPNNLLSNQFVKAWQQQYNQANHQQLQLLVNVDKLSVSIMDELNDICLFREILRVTIDKIDLCFHQRIIDIQPILYQRQLLGSIDQLQIDNQCYSPKENYDFPVVLMSKDETRVSKTKTDIYDKQDRDGSISSNNLSRLQRQNSSSSMDTNLTEDPLPAIDSSSYNHKISRPMSNNPDENKFVTLRFHRINHRFIILEFEIQPFDVYLEDHYIYFLLNIFSHLLPLDLRTPMHLKENDPRVEFIDNHLMTVPFVCESLSIGSIDIVVSVHASMKLYIGCHQLPMFVDKFQRNYIFSTQRQLLTLISRHYIVALLTRSPLLLGSFDLLGNPSVLIRNLTDGIYDLFHLPYVGMRRGPSGFMMGISEGATSLLKHLSLGTLTSLTTFANSVARNMDRLAMDSEHTTRTEETCRQIPTGMTDGLLQGLELFSLSLLGAIAGLAEQPMASFRNRPESQTATTTVLSGVGKGLVGVVVKPVGGVAQLISQTGQGILYGTGLMNIPHRRHRQLEQRVNVHAGVSYLKLHRYCSISDNNNNNEIIDTLDYVLEHSLTEQGILVLTKNGHLIVYHKNDESQHGQYSLDNVDLRESSDSNGLLLLDNLSLYVDARHRGPFLALCRQIRR